MTIPDLQGTHGTAIVPDKNLGFVTAGRQNAVAAFDLKTLKVTKTINMPGRGSSNPDAIIYDPASKKVFALCAGGDAVAIDPANLEAPQCPSRVAENWNTAEPTGKGRSLSTTKTKARSTSSTPRP